MAFVCRPVRSAKDQLRSRWFIKCCANKILDQLTTTHGHLRLDTRLCRHTRFNRWGTNYLCNDLSYSRYNARHDMREKDVVNREKLYSEFLTEVADLYVDSLNRTLDDVGKPAAFVAAYALLGRIRMISSEAVLKSADRVIQDIIEAYNRPPRSIQELKKLTDERPADPWHEFTEACRAEREALLKRL
jgi:hypothetical protein